MTGPVTETVTRLASVTEFETWVRSSSTTACRRRRGRKLGGSAGAGSDRSANRDSVPPRGGDYDTPGKADSVRPSPAGSRPRRHSGPRSPSSRGRTWCSSRSRRRRPRASSGCWGGYSRSRARASHGGTRCRTPTRTCRRRERVEYRTSASSMIPIPASGAELPPLDRGKTVLAPLPRQHHVLQGRGDGERGGHREGQPALRGRGEQCHAAAGGSAVCRRVQELTTERGTR